VKVVAPPSHSNKVRSVDSAKHSGIVNLIRAIADGTELFKQLSDNKSLRRCLSDAIFRTRENEAA